MFPESRTISQKTRSKLLEDILESYAKIGFQNATVTQSSITLQDALGPTLKTTILYETGEIRPRPYLAHFSGVDRHFYLTLISTVEAKASANRLFNELLESIVLTAGPKSTDGSIKSGSHRAAVLSVAILLLLAGWLLLVKNKRARN